MIRVEKSGIILAIDGSAPRSSYQIRVGMSAGAVCRLSAFEFHEQYAMRADHQWRRSANWIWRPGPTEVIVPAVAEPMLVFG
jgi:hypothetical protein